jgi:hypothetical protein
MFLKTCCFRLSLVFLVVSCLSAPLYAQSKKEKAVTLARAGVALLEEGKLDEALKMFEEAYRLDPAPVLLGHMAKVYQKKGDALKARELYEQWVASETDPKRQEKAKARLQELLDSMFGKLTVSASPQGALIKVDDKEVQSGVPLELPRGTHKVEVTLRNHSPETRTVQVIAGTNTELTIELKPLLGKIEVRGEPKGAVVSVNGTDARRLPLDKPFEVSPGLHVVEVTAEGFEKMQKTVQVGPGETVSVVANLKPLAPVAIQPPAPSKAEKPVVEKVQVEVQKPRRSPWPWVSLGVGVATTGVGIAMSILAHQERQKVRDAEKEGDVALMTMSEAQSHVSKAETYDKVSYAMFGLGGVAIVTGVVLAVTLRPKEAKASKEVLIVGASFVPGGGIVSLEGRF